MITALIEPDTFKEVKSIYLFNLFPFLFLLNDIENGLYLLNMKRGTGSKPCVPPGRHLNILLSPIAKPVKGPWILSASTIYSEHVGICRHAGFKKGEIEYL